MQSVITAMKIKLLLYQFGLQPSISNVKIPTMLMITSVFIIQVKSGVTI